MTCSEKELQQLIEKAVNQAVEPLMEEITELKKQQQESFKRALEETISHQVAQMIEEKIDKIANRLHNNDKTLGENQRAMVELLMDLKKDLAGYIRELKDKDDEALEKGEKILETLDDISKGMITAHDNILDSNQDWGDTIMSGLVKLGEGIAGLREKIDNSTRYLQQNNENTLNRIKRVEETIIRNKW